MSKLGRVTAFTAEAALWVTGAALIASAAGMHWKVDILGTSLGNLVGAQASISASPSSSGGVAVTPAPGASPTMSPVGQKFLAFVSQTNLQYRAKVWVEFTGAGSGRTVTSSESGTLSSGKGATSTSYRMTLNGAVTTNDKIILGGTTYQRVNGAAWTKAATTAADATSSGPSVGSRMQFADAGLETKNGLELHRLELINTGEFADSMTKSLGSSFTSNDETLTVWVHDDGTPVVLEVDGSFAGTTNGVAFTGTMIERFTYVTFSGVTITAPS